MNVMSTGKSLKKESIDGVEPDADCIDEAAGFGVLC